jgi:peptidoglycan/LPS O-acetylase OafA/YrhL
MGMLFALDKMNILTGRIANVVLLILGLVCLVPFYLSDNLGGNTGFTIYYCIFILTSPIIYIHIFRVFQCDKHGKFLRWIGALSLEIYLVQVTLMPITMKFFNTIGIEPFVNVVTSITIVVFISVIIHKTNKLISAYLL